MPAKQANYDDCGTFTGKFLEHNAQILTKVKANKEKIPDPDILKLRKLLSIIPTTKRPDRPRAKHDRLPPGVSRAIAVSLKNSSKRIRPNESNDETQGTQLIPLIADTKTLLTPYLNLHHSCVAAQHFALPYWLTSYKHYSVST
jgi:hypothetical protein